VEGLKLIVLKSRPL